MQTITIKDKVIPLLFDMAAFGEIEETVGSLADLNAVLNGEKRIKSLIKIITIMGNQGLEENGEKPTLDEKWVGRNLKPYMLAECQMAVVSAISEGMKMETEDDGKERDLVLEEIEKKSETER